MTDPIATRRWLSGANASMRLGQAWQGAARPGKTRQGLLRSGKPVTVYRCVKHQCGKVYF